MKICRTPFSWSQVYVPSSQLHHLLWGTACRATPDSAKKPIIPALQKLFLGKYHGHQPGRVSVGGSSAGGRSRMAGFLPLLGQHGQ